MEINVTNKNITQDISSISTKKYTEALIKKTPYRVLKRIMDVILATIGLLVLSPIFAIIALLIKLESKGPIFFKHTLIGQYGKIIKLY